MTVLSWKGNTLKSDLSISITISQDQSTYKMNILKRKKQIDQPYI